MPDAPALALSFIEPDIAACTFDAPGKGANIMSRAVLVEFEKLLDDLAARPGLAGLVIRSAKPGIFIAGADLREFVASQDASRDDIVALASRGRTLFARLAACPYVTVAAIDGVCVGGGAELAMWCDRRVMSLEKASYGFPEVKLGLFPGWGGTARTPRMIGLSNAVEMVTGGESIDARAAQAMGLANDVATGDRLDAAAVAMIRAEQRTREYLADRQRWAGPIDIGETELGFLGAAAAGYIQQQTKGNYPAPMAALEVMLGGAALDLETAGEQEAAAFAELFGTPISRALINVFFLGDRNKKDPGIENRQARPRAIESLGVFGAGIMGSGIAAASVKRDLPTTIADAAPAALAGGVRKVLEEVSYNKATRGVDAQRMLAFAPLVRSTTLDAEFASCDLVIEAVVENPQVKMDLLRRIEPVLSESAILASNTSAISIGKLARALRRPERFCGIHFFNPVRKMQLVEVICGPQTSDETVATAVAYAKAIGKSPIVVQDGPGFLVNRLLLPYMNEALELLQDGVPMQVIERAAKSFGMPMGPMTLYDVVGIDTAWYAGKAMREGFPDRVVESPVLATMVQAGRLGQKSGAGFYSYRAKADRGQPDPALAPLLAPHARTPSQWTEDQVTARLFLPMVLEATRVLEEKKVRDPRDVDLGLIYGIGFPPFRGGLLYWADTVGAAAIVERLKPFEALGARYAATPMLLELARNGATFYRN